MPAFGLPVESATRIVAAAAPESLAAPMSTAADLLALGADPDHAWTMAADERRRIIKRNRIFPGTCDAGPQVVAGRGIADSGVDELAVEIRRRAGTWRWKAERAGARSVVRSACVFCRRSCVWASSRSSSAWPAACSPEVYETCTRKEGDHAEDQDSGDRRLVRRMQAEVLRLATDDEGMSTAEYAIGTVAAAAFGALLYTVVTGDSITSALSGIISKALSTSVG